jgi:hypothetical protein
MRVLFDRATPVPIRRYLTGHTVSTAFQRGWDKLKNGELPAAAEQAGFDLFLTTDKNMRYQQNFAGPNDCNCGARSAAMAARSATYPACSQCREFSYAGQLCRG